MGGSILNAGRLSDLSVNVIPPSPKLNTTVLGVDSEPNGRQRPDEEFSLPSGFSEVGVSDLTSSRGSLKGISGGFVGMRGLR